MMSFLVELSNLILFMFLPIYTIFACSCNTRDQHQLHLERRQALRDRQRQAVLSGRSVRSVIETEVESETTQCPRMTCVRMAPRLKTRRDVYEKLDQCDNIIDRMDGNQLERVVVVKNEKKTERTVKSVRYSDLVSNDFDGSTSSESCIDSMAG